VVLCDGEDVKIPVVANSQDQLRDGLWPELAKWLQHLPEELRAEVVWEKEKVYLKALPEAVLAVRRTASVHRPEALQGIHATTVLAILEEASGIPEQTIEAGAGTLSTPGALAVAVGNPTRASGFFFDTHHRLADGWDTMVVNSEDVPRAQGHIRDIIETYGRNSNAYRVRVRGEFPVQDDQAVIPLELIKAAFGRDVTKAEVWPVWGVDVAGHGDDRTTLLRRQGNWLIALPNVWRNMDGNQVAGRIIAEYNATSADEQPKCIAIHVIGVGYSVYDALRREGSPVRSIVRGINVAEEPSSDDHDRKLRDQLWFAGRAWFAAKDCCIPRSLVRTVEDEKLLDLLFMELSSATYDFDESGRRVVERKKDQKKRLGFSPNLADGFLLTFAAGVFPRESAERYRRWHDADAGRTGWTG
jgi:hypothetical protein